MRNTAVEMFATKVMALDITPKQMLYFLDWYQLALEMEKLEIESAYDSGMCEGFDIGHKKEYTSDMTGEIYYKETYEKK